MTWDSATYVELMFEEQIDTQVLGNILYSYTPYGVTSYVLPFKKEIGEDKNQRNRITEIESQILMKKDAVKYVYVFVHRINTK